MRQMVIDLLEADLAADGFDLIEVRIFRGGGRHQVRLYVDTQGGVTLDGCAAASRTAGMLLEEADLFPGPYVIEVSSPGIRRPLRTTAHFTAAVGSEVELKLKPDQQPGRLRGRLLEVGDAALTLEVAQTSAGVGEEEAVRTVALDQIQEANLEPAFDAQALINADRRARKEAKRERRKEAADGRRARSRRKPPKAGPLRDGGGEKTD